MRCKGVPGLPSSTRQHSWSLSGPSNDPEPVQYALRHQSRETRIFRLQQVTHALSETVAERLKSAKWSPTSPSATFTRLAVPAVTSHHITEHLYYTCKLSLHGACSHSSTLLVLTTL